MSDVSDSLLNASRGAPDLDPQTAYAVGASVPSSDAATVAGGVNSFNQYSRQVKWLADQEPNLQLSYWHSIPQASRQIYTQLGYIPPAVAPPPKKHNRFFGGIGHLLNTPVQWYGGLSHIVGGAITLNPKGIASGAGEYLHGFTEPFRAANSLGGAATSQVENIPGTRRVLRPLGGLKDDALHYAGAPLRQLQHAERTAILAGEQFGDKVGPFSGDWILNTLTGRISAHEWHQAWNETKNGEKVYEPTKMRQLVDKYTPDVLEFAKTIASNPADQQQTAITNQLARIAKQQFSSDAEKQTAIDEFIAKVGSREVQSAIQDLQHSKISLGRALTPLEFYDHHIPILGKSLGDITSGSVDALADWYTDPLVIAGKAAEASRLAKYGIQTMDDVDRVITQPAVQRKLINAGALLDQENGIGKMVARFPELTNAASDIAAFRQEGMSGRDTLEAFFRDSAGMKAILEGRATRISSKGVLFPYQTRLGSVAGDTKSLIEHAIDFSSTKSTSVPGVGKVFNGLNGVGRNARMFFNLAPAGLDGDLADPKFTGIIRQIGKYALPDNRIDFYVNAWAESRDLGTKNNIYNSLLEEVFNAANLKENPETRAWTKRFFEDKAAADAKRAYSPHGIDHMADSDVSSHASPLLAQDLTTSRSIPSFSELWTHSKQTGLLGKTVAPFNIDGVDYYMSRIWKPLVLMRPAFPLRAGGEEFVGAVMRDGLKGLIQAGLGHGNMRAEYTEKFYAKAFNELSATGMNDADVITALAPYKDHVLPYNPVSAIYHRYVSSLDPEAQARVVNSPLTLFAESLADRTRRSFRAVEGKLATDKYRAAAERVLRINEGAIPDEISAVEQQAGGYAASATNSGDLTEMIHDGKHVRTLEMRGTGDYKNYTPADRLYTLTWKRDLDKLASDPFSIPALSHVGDRNAQVEAVKQAILDNPELASKSERMVRTRDMLYTNDASVKAEDWASAVVDHVNAVVAGPNGEEIPDLIPHLTAMGKGPTTDFLDNVATELRPTQVNGPELFGVSRSILNDLISKGFANVVGRPMNWLARQPMFVHNYAQSWDEIQGFRSLFAKGPQYEIAGADLYHGASEAPAITGDIDQLLFKGAGAENLFGAGLYATDSPNIAASYAKVRGGNKVISGFKFSKDAKVLDLEQQLPTAAKAVFRSAIDTIESSNHLDYDIDGLNRAKELINNGKGAEAYTTLKDALVVGDNDYFSIQEELNALTESLGEHYDALSYAGGLRVGGGETHTAYAFLHPDTALTKVGETTITKAQLAAERATERSMEELAHTRALEKTTPFIHNPQVRSQFSIVTRNLAPFWFAQEQFYKRWSRTAKYAPASFRQAQLTMGGLRHYGFLHKDANGDDYFNYPMMGAVDAAVSHLYQSFTGSKYTLPMPSQLFTGQVKFASPGLERLGAPSVSPIAAVPLHALAQRFPELHPLESKVLGPGAGKSYWEMITPTTFTRVLKALTAKEGVDQQYTSASMQAFAHLSAAGYAPPQDASAEVLDKFNTRVKDWTRVMMLMRAVFGAVSPSSPTADFDPANFHEEFQSLLNSGVDWNDAVYIFLKEHPEATAYTIGQTKAAGTEPLPATSAAVKFINNNTDFIKRYPLSSGWFLPSAPGKWNPDAYHQQLAYQLRKHSTLSDFEHEIYYSQAADEYFNKRDAYQSAIDNARNNADTDTAQLLNQEWANWSATYKDSHHVFADELTSTDRQAKRNNTITELRAALADPGATPTPQVTHMRDLFDAYDSYNANISQFRGLTTAEATLARHDIKAVYKNAFTTYLHSHPDVVLLYNRLLRFDIDGEEIQ